MKTTAEPRRPEHPGGARSPSPSPVVAPVPSLDLTAVPPVTVAAAGLRGPSQPLPHRDAIARSFGRHGEHLAGVQAHVGGPARAAARDLGATAFTRGDAVGFADTPTLRTTAHEAAHVVQQRRGLALPDGRGRPDDRHERLADEVADAVVAGRSAETLLADAAPPPGAPPAAGPAVVQCEPDPRTAAPAQNDPILRSPDPDVDDRRSSELVASQRVMAQRYRRAVTSLRRIAGELQRSEVRFAQERGLIGRGFDLFNSQPRPDPARWDFVRENWDLAASLLDTALGLPSVPGFVGAIGQSLEAAIEAYRDVLELHNRQAGRFNDYTGGHISAGEEVVAAFNTARDLALLAAIVAAAGLAAPYLAAAAPTATALNNASLISVAARVAPVATTAILSDPSRLQRLNDTGAILGGAALQVALAPRPAEAARDLLTPQGALGVLVPLAANGTIRLPGFGGGAPNPAIPRPPQAAARVAGGGQRITPPAPAASGAEPTVATREQFLANARRSLPTPPGGGPTRFDPARHPPLVSPPAGDRLSNEVTQPQAPVTINTPTRPRAAPLASAPTALQVDRGATGTGSTTRLPVPDVLSDTPTQRVPVPNPALARTQPALSTTIPPAPGYPELAGERPTVRLPSVAPASSSSPGATSTPSSASRPGGNSSSLSGGNTGDIVFGRREVLAVTEPGPNSPVLPPGRTPSAVDPQATTQRPANVVDPQASTRRQPAGALALPGAPQSASLQEQFQRLYGRYGTTPAERADRLSRATPGEINQFVEDWAAVLERWELARVEGRPVTPADPSRALLDSGVPIGVHQSILRRFAERVSLRQASLRQAQQSDGTLAAARERIQQLSLGFERRASVRSLWGDATSRYPYWYAVEANFEAQNIPPPVRAQVRTLLIRIEDQPLSSPGLTTGAIPASLRPLFDASFLIGRMGVIPIQSGEGAIDVRRPGL